MRVDRSYAVHFAAGYPPAAWVLAAGTKRPGRGLTRGAFHSAPAISGTIYGAIAAAGCGL